MTNKDVEKLKSSKLMKSMGVKSIEIDGPRASLSIDPNMIPESRRKSIGAGLVRADAATMYNNPFEPSFFDPTVNVDTMDVHQKIRMAMQYFDKDPLVGRIIEVMKIFANDGFKNQHRDKKIKKFYDDWCSAVDMDLVLGWIFLEYFLSGNVTTMRDLLPFSEKNFKFAAPEYSADGSDGSLNKAEAAKKYTYSAKSIPGGYTVMNPLSVYVDTLNAYGDSLYFNQGNQIKVKNGTSSDIEALLISKLPGEVQNQAKSTGKIPLGQKNIKRILRMRQPYQPYGKVLMERAFAAIYEKNKLREMDMAMVNSVINQIIKVTIGDKDYPATSRQLKNLAEAFSNVGKSQVIFWNHTLSIEVIRPDTKVLNIEKFDRVNEDIRNAFGVSEVILGGGSSKTNFATAYLSLKVFISNLIEARKDVKRWLRGEYADIAEAMGFDSYPEPEFNQLSMTDEVAEKQLIMQMVDRGIISYESAQSRLGYDPSIEVARREVEKPLMEKNILGPVMIPGQVPGDSGKAIKKEDKKTVDNSDKKTNQQNRMASVTGNPNGVSMKGGRPKTPKGNYSEKRATPKVKGQASEELEEA